jgi:hypothetical protein
VKPLTSPNCQTAKRYGRRASSPLLFGRRGGARTFCPRVAGDCPSRQTRGGGAPRGATVVKSRRPLSALRGPNADSATPCGAPPRTRSCAWRDQHPLAAFEMPRTRAVREREVSLLSARTMPRGDSKSAPAGFRPPFVRSVPRRKRHPPVMVGTGPPRPPGTLRARQGRRRRIPPRCTTPHEAPLADGIDWNIVLVRKVSRAMAFQVACSSIRTLGEGVCDARLSPNSGAKADIAGGPTRAKSRYRRCGLNHVICDARSRGRCRYPQRLRGVADISVRICSERAPPKPP